MRIDLLLYLVYIYIYIYILESHARFARAQFSLSWDSQAGQIWSKIDLRRLPHVKRARNELRKSRSTSVPPMEMRKVLDFGVHLRPRRRAKSIRNRVEMVLRMKKCRIIHFYTPPLQNHNFWLPMDTKMPPQWRPGTILAAIKIDARKAMLCRELLETFLHLEATAGERRVPSWSPARNPSYI